MNTVTIEHSDGRRVKGARRTIEGSAMEAAGWCWWREEATDIIVYFGDSWREVEQALDVTDKYDPSYDSRYEMAQCLVGPHGLIFCELPKGSTWRKVQAVVLPEYRETFTAKEWNDYVKEHETTCLQIWEGEI